MSKVSQEAEVIEKTCFSSTLKGLVIFNQIQENALRGLSQRLCPKFAQNTHEISKLEKLGKFVMVAILYENWVSVTSIRIRDSNIVDLI